MQMSQTVSVSSLVLALQDLVEENFVEVLVQGELTGFTKPASGHCYFSLKDTKAQLRCAMFRPHARLLRFQPENGMELICRGRVSIYPQRGELQLIVEALEPLGAGALELAFQQLRQRLEKEGLFAADKKQLLPEHPATIGIVTSATGAAIHDILTVLRRRSAGVKVLLRSVRVQGEGAAAEIAAAIADLNSDGRADVLIVGRGGGSREDLWAFNEEVVARAIAASKIPLISAVGHEVDLSIADLVADLRAPTPSAAAELVVSDRLELERHLDQLQLRLVALMKARLESAGNRFNGMRQRLRSPRAQIDLRRAQLQQLQLCLQQALERPLASRAAQLANLTGRLDALSPLKVLGRGYSISRLLPAGDILQDAQQLKTGDLLELQLANGQVEAQVTRVRKNRPGKKRR